MLDRRIEIEKQHFKEEVEVSLASVCQIKYRSGQLSIERSFRLYLILSCQLPSYGKVYFV